MNMLKKLNTKVIVRITAILLITMSIIGSVQLIQEIKIFLNDGEITQSQLLSMFKSYLIYSGVFTFIIIGFSLFVIHKKYKLNFKNIITALFASFYFMFLIPGLFYFPEANGISIEIFALSLLGIVSLISLSILIKSLPEEVFKKFTNSLRKI